MPVVINDFEVVPPTPRDGTDSQARSDQSTPAQVEELARALEQRLVLRRERRERVDAT